MMGGDDLPDENDGENAAAEQQEENAGSSQDQPSQ